MAGGGESGKGARDPLLVAVGARIKGLREADRVTPADFARAAGVSLQYLWRVETGQQNLNLTSVSRFALALGRPMAALLDGIDAEPATLGKRAYVPRPKKEGKRTSGDGEGG